MAHLQFVVVMNMANAAFLCFRKAIPVIAVTLASMAIAQPEALLGNDTEDGARGGVGGIYAGRGAMLESSSSLPSEYCLITL